MLKSVRSICIASAAVAFAGSAVPAGAAMLYTNDFSGTTNGNLVTDQTTGQAGFVQTGTTATSPIQVNAGVITLGNTGQDVSASLSTSAVAGQSVYISTLINVSAAQTTGDYFLNLSNSLQGTSFQSRVFAKSSGTGYVLGFQASSAGVVYGTTELAFGTAVRVVARYDIVSGATNDVGYLYVNPTGTNEASQTPYLAATTFTQAENAQTLAAINLRQGTAANAPTLTVDDLTVATTFAEAVPEPTSAGLIGVAGLGLLARRRAARRA